VLGRAGASWQSQVYDQLRDREWHQAGALFDEVRDKIPLHVAMRHAYSLYGADGVSGGKAQWLYFTQVLKRIDVERQTTKRTWVYQDKVRLKHVDGQVCPECGGPVIKASWSQRSLKHHHCLACHPIVPLAEPVPPPEPVPEPAQEPAPEPVPKPVLVSEVAGADAANPVELDAGDPDYAISHPLAAAVIRLASLHSADKLAALGETLEDNGFTSWPLLDPLLMPPALTRLQRIEGWLALWRGDRFHRYVLAREGPDYQKAYRLTDDLCWQLGEAERRGEVDLVRGQAEDALELINGQTLHAIRVVFAADKERVKTRPATLGIVKGRARKPPPVPTADPVFVFVRPTAFIWLDQHGPPTSLAETRAFNKFYRGLVEKRRTKIDGAKPFSKGYLARKARAVVADYQDDKARVGIVAC
jgi:hypothetical protein